MKKYVFILLLLPLFVQAQITITPFVGLNSTRMTDTYSGYTKGGNYGFFGVEVEGRKKPKPYSSVYLSATTGLTYLPNGFSYSSSVPLGTTGLSARSTNIQTRYLQVPLSIRLNWRPFPLVEDWRIFFGAGVSYNMLTYAHISEESTYISIPIFYNPPTSTYLQDSRDVTNIAVKNSIFKRFELGMKFKHVQVTWRLSFSTQDMYFKGLEQEWKVPATNSFYLDAHDSQGITKEKYSEIIFGWRF